MSAVNQEYLIVKDEEAGNSFHELLFKASLPEDKAQFTTEELVEFGNIAAKTLWQYQNRPVINFTSKKLEKFDKPLSILTIVNSNKQFLFDSIVQAVGTSGARLYMVAHPVLEVAKNEKGELLVALKACQDLSSMPKQRLSMIQFIISHLSEEQCTTLKQEIDKSLEDVEEATLAWSNMLEQAKNMQLLWQDTIPSNANAKTVVEFLNWLIEGNFTFLSAATYEIVDNHLELKQNLGANLPEENLINLPTEVVTITKADQRSHVHRFTWLDDLQIVSPDKKTCLRILGLFTSTAYNHSVFQVPYIKDKVKEIIGKIDYSVEDHCGKTLINVLENYPRDELFWLSSEELARNCYKILALEEKSSLQVISHIAKTSPVITVLVYLPRAQYNVNNCEAIGNYLKNSFSGDFYEYSSFFVNAATTRLYYVIHRKDRLRDDLNDRKLSADIEELVRPWQDNLALYASAHNISEETVALAAKFPSIYRDALSPEEALDDAKHILKLDADKDLFVKFCKTVNVSDPAYVTLKLYHRQSALMLSERVPLLENMGFKVIDEQTFELLDADDNVVYMHNMCLQNANNLPVDLSDGGALLNDSFEQIWAEKVDEDAYNKLCQSAKLAPREVLILRIYGRYMQQIGTPYSQDYIAATLDNYSDIASDLYNLFYRKFALDLSENLADIEQEAKNIEKKLQKVPNLDDDAILRRYLNLIKASLRTNAFASDEKGQLVDIIAIKFNPKLIVDLPEPKPYREIFVYSMLVEGVHLRFGPVARGGIRWSDRALDYRTEILGLVKAQQVKNVVIVPVGSKGGFYPRQLPDTNDRSIVSEAARQAYIGYINAMLSITDNLVAHKLVSPKQVKSLDEYDPYFVVAADKGTASFSDTANSISAQHNFWLDDAFASGGSDGYDHKKMAITAKGAWEAVKRHFRELLNRDIQTEDFTVAGVGDMSGDVFGNGMLLSKHIKLVAAFDHRDIFIDPNPDAETSYAERSRLFNLERSSWQDYDKTKLSKGGAIYSRKLKEIDLSPEAAAALGLSCQKATPFEVIRAILKADVDLLWFGGIGTYIRASSETDVEVGDRANDKIRIAGCELRAKVIGEGANLGLTQKGRIEYSMNGGRCNTDAIDNSAGVNCSDVEVNIKIALSTAMAQNMLTRPERNELLKAMTDDVAKLVLRNNYLQSLIISLCRLRSSQDISQQKLFIENLEKEGLLDRKLEVLPDDSEISQRILHGQALTRPELSVIIAYAKLVLQKEISENEFINENYFETRLINYFPHLMQEKYKEFIVKHQLRGPIIATLLVNSVINSTGPTFIFQLAEKCNINIIEVVKAYIYIYDGFNIAQITDKIDALDNKIKGELQNELYNDLSSYLSQAIELFFSTSLSYPQLITNYTIEEIIAKISELYQYFIAHLQDILPSSLCEHYQQKKEAYLALGVDSSLAESLCSLKFATRCLNILPIAVQENLDSVLLSKVYFALYVMFNVNQIEEASRTIPTIDYYDNLSVSMSCSSMSQSLRKLSINIVQKGVDAENPLALWQSENEHKIASIRQRINALVENDLNISRFVVAASMLQELVN